MNNFIIKGAIAYSEDKNTIKTIDNGYLVCENGKVAGVFREIPEKYENFPVKYHGKNLVIPGMTDLHVHAPQYTFRGIGMDLELLDWLTTYTFPEEAKYAKLEYADKAYSFFAKDLQRGFSTRACIFGTLHNEATINLMDKVEATGVISYVGKVNMDRNGGENLQEADAKKSMEDTIKWLDTIDGRYKNVRPIITPRFIPSCSDELMNSLGKLARDRKLRIQSHLSENPSEVAWVKELVPSSTSYANAYELFDNMGEPDRPTIMAHCVYSGDEEMDILKRHGAYVAHCADSNMNLTSGIAPIRRFLDADINIGLGSDVAAGSSMNMLKLILTSLQASKMYYRYVDNNMKQLSFEEMFYLATMGGGRYFGKVGTFKEGYEFDALVINDSMMYSMRDMTTRERIERMCYNDADTMIVEKYVAGRKIFEK